VGKATAFISHTWSSSFRDLVLAIETFEAEKNVGGGPREEMFYWLDVACFNQHNNTSKLPPDFWSGTFSRLVGGIGHTLAIFTPWHSPESLKRIWCVWELAASLETGAKLQIVMPPADYVRLRRSLLKDFDSVRNALNRINLQQAQATVKSDRKKILKSISQSPGGFADVESRVRNALQEWLFRAGKHAILYELDDESDDLFADNAKMNAHERALGQKQGPRALQLLSQVCRMCAAAKMNDETIMLLRAALDSFVGRFGVNHFYSLVVKANLAHALEEHRNRTTMAEKEEVQQLLSEVLVGFDGIKFPEDVSIGDASVSIAKATVRAKLDSLEATPSEGENCVVPGSGEKSGGSKPFMFDIIGASLGWLQPSDPRMTQLFDEIGS